MPFQFIFGNTLHWARLILEALIDFIVYPKSNNLYLSWSLLNIHSYVVFLHSSYCDLELLRDALFIVIKIIYSEVNYYRMT